jgi:DNA-binding NarL/FixJ family response regulator
MRQSERIRIHIIHSDPLIAAGLTATLSELREFELVCHTPSAKVKVIGRASIRPAAHVVVADYESGMRLIASPDSLGQYVVILTHSDSEAKICHALEQGARGYVLLGGSVADLVDALKSVYGGGIAIGPLVASRIADCMKQQALTRRETEIMRQMMLGMSNKAIASKLILAVGTVKTHVKSILEKLDANSRTEAVSIAPRRGMLREEEAVATRGTVPVLMGIGQPGLRPNAESAREPPYGVLSN